MMRAPSDFLAGIRGICVGAEDLEANDCFGNFSTFVHSRYPASGTSSLHSKLARLCDGNTLWEACNLVGDLIQAWKEVSPVLPACRHSSSAEVDPDDWGRWCISRPGDYYHPGAWGKSVDVSTFELMVSVLRRPHDYLPGVTTLRELEAFFWGIQACRRPPHGAIAGVAEYYDFLRKYLPATVPFGDDWLLGALGEYSFDEGCSVRAALIGRWLEEAESFYVVSAACTICRLGPVGFRKCSDNKTLVLVCDDCDVVWLHPDDMTARAALRELSGNHWIESLGHSIGVSAGASWATLKDIRNAQMDGLVAGVRRYVSRSDKPGNSPA